MNRTKTLCHMAWDYPMFFMFNNSVGYCCRTPKIPIDDNLLDSMGIDFWSNHPVFVERRRALLDGVQHSDCKTCWKLEDAGFKSSRNDGFIQYFMNRNDKNFPLNLPLEEYKNWPNLERSNYSNCIEIVLNNTCDAKCTYCSEFYSTQWVTEKRKYGELAIAYKDQNKRNPKAEKLFWQWYESKAIFSNRRFGFIGGEPLIIDAQYECFDKLIEIHDRVDLQPHPEFGKMEICITSNLNTPPNYFEKFLKYIPKLEKYFKIIIQVSGESVGDDLEYIRHGVKWARWSSNIEYLLANTNVSLNFLPCLNLLSIPRFSDYLEYFKNLCEKYRYMEIYDNIVTHPIEQSPLIAPKEFAKYFDRSIEIMKSIVDKNIGGSNRDPRTMAFSHKNFLYFLEKTQKAILDNPSEVEPTENANRFANFVNKLDQRRSTRILEVFPEFTTFKESGEKYI